MEKDIELKNTKMIKTFLMFLVVLYHSMVFWTENWFTIISPEPSRLLKYFSLWLNTFPIYGFVLISGYLFQVLRNERNHYRNFIEFLKKKVRRLLIPLVFINLIWAAPFYSYFFHPSIDTLLSKFLLMESPSQLWFLAMLFIVFLLYWPISNFVDNNIVTGGALAILYLVLGTIGEKLFPNIFQIWTGMQFVIYFYLGVCLRKDRKCHVYKIPSVLYLVLHIMLFFFWTNISVRNGLFYKLASFVISELMYVIGAIGAFAICERLTKILPDSNWLLNLGCKYSMTIYLFHQQIIYVFLIILNRRLSPYILVIVCFVGTLVISLLISFIMNHFRITRFLTSGAK